MKKSVLKIFETRLQQSRREENEKKTPFSVSLTPSERAWLQEQPNASAFIQKIIDSTIKRERNESALALLTEIVLKYDLWQMPSREELENYDKRFPSAQGGEERKEHWQREIKEDGKHREILVTDYVDFVLCTGGGTEVTREEVEFLKSLNQMDRTELVNLIWESFQRYLKETEVKEELPLIQFAYDLAEKRPKKTYSVKQLADAAGIEYHVFYHKVLPRLKRIAECMPYNATLSIR